MTVFVAAAMFDGADASPLPDSCVAALRLPGASAAVRHAMEGFACAAARTGAAGDAMHVSRGIVVAGDVRLDGRADVVRALRASPGQRDPDKLRTPDRAPDRGGPGAADDLALVLAAYLAWGPSAVERLRGDFSFVLWDSARRALVAARDGLGVRPLYYAQVPGGLCVSNALDAVRAHPAVRSTIRASAIVSFLEHGWNRDTATTTFAAISRLPPGTVLQQASGQRNPVMSVHWRMPDPAPLHYHRDDEYVEHYRALLAEAVRDRITGPTTILLSGGLDSTSIAATARSVAAGVPLRAVTTRTPDVESPEEARLAAAVAACTEIAHEIREEPVAPFTGSRAWTPEPFDDPELPASAAFFASLGQTAPVILQGEDGDALFSPPSLAAMVRRESAAAVLGQVVMYTLRHRHHPYLGLWLGRRLRLLRRQPAGARPAWLTSNAGASPGEPACSPNAARPEAALRLTASIWQSVHQGTDRAFLGAPVEFRWPLLDTRLIEFVFAIPPIPWCQRKLLVRRAFARELPAAVIERPKTPVPGFFEHTVTVWRRRTGAACPPLHARTLEFVDMHRLADTLRSGDTEDVLAGWRALQLDHWFRDLEAA